MKNIYMNNIYEKSLRWFCHLSEKAKIRMFIASYDIQLGSSFTKFNGADYHKDHHEVMLTGSDFWTGFFFTINLIQRKKWQEVLFYLISIHF